MLWGMQETAGDTPTTAASFASLLAALAAQTPEPAGKPAKQKARKQAAWSDDDLEDDVATLSYEQALRAHARRTPAALAPKEAMPTGRAAKREKAVRKAASRWSTLPRESRKSVSVTIRMSQSECEQLNARAAEAGMTISAYLRSCTFEAEALRAQVKETLAKLRQPRQAEEKKPPESEKPALQGWRTRLLPRWAQGRDTEA